MWPIILATFCAYCFSSSLQFVYFDYGSVLLRRCWALHHWPRDVLGGGVSAKYTKCTKSMSPKTVLAHDKCVDCWRISPMLSNASLAVQGAYWQTTNQIVSGWTNGVIAKQCDRTGSSNGCISSNTSRGLYSRPHTCIEHCLVNCISSIRGDLPPCGWRTVVRRIFRYKRKMWKASWWTLNISCGSQSAVRMCRSARWSSYSDS